MHVGIVALGRGTWYFASLQVSILVFHWERGGGVDQKGFFVCVFVLCNCATVLWLQRRVAKPQAVASLTSTVMQLNTGGSHSSKRNSRLYHKDTGSEGPDITRGARFHTPPISSPTT